MLRLPWRSRLASRTRSRSRGGRALVGLSSRTARDPSGAPGERILLVPECVLSSDLMPHVNTVDGDPSVAYAMAYLGSGVAMSTYCGGLAADLVAGKDVPRDTPLRIGHLDQGPCPTAR